jgi:hypothetical protein
MQEAIRVVSDFYGVDITKKTRSTEVRQARQVYMYCMLNINAETKLYSLEGIANSVGLLSHAIVLHGAKMIEQDMLWDKELRQDVKSLMPLIRAIYKVGNKSITNASSFIKVKGFRTWFLTKKQIAKVEWLMEAYAEYYAQNIVKNNHQKQTEVVC